MLFFSEKIQPRTISKHPCFLLSFYKQQSQYLLYSFAPFDTFPLLLRRVPFYDFQQLRTKLMTRQRKLMRRTLENQAYLKRLAKVKSHYDHKKDELDYQRMHSIVAFKPVKCDLKYYSPLVQFQKRLDVVKVRYF